MLYCSISVLDGHKRWNIRLTFLNKVWVQLEGFEWQFDKNQIKVVSSHGIFVQNTYWYICKSLSSAWPSPQNYFLVLLDVWILLITVTILLQNKWTADMCHFIIYKLTLKWPLTYSSHKGNTNLQFSQHTVSMGVYLQVKNSHFIL